MNNNLICWDSGVLISWVTGEYKDRLPGIAAVIKGIEGGRYILTVSDVINEEVQWTKMSDDAKEKFAQFMRNRQIIKVIPNGHVISKKAEAIISKTNLKKKDATHVAVAIIVKAQVLHTYDNGILKYDGRTEVEKLAIKKCNVPIPGEIQTNLVH